MTTSMIAVAATILAIGLVLFIVKRVVRFAIKLALLGIVMLAMLAGAVTWWWYGAGSDTPATGSRDTRKLK